MQLTLLVVQVSILYYGGHLVISGQMSSGNLIAFIIYEFVLGDCMEVRGGWGEGGHTGVRQVRGDWGEGVQARQVRGSWGGEGVQVRQFGFVLGTCKTAFRPISAIQIGCFWDNKARETSSEPGQMTLPLEHMGIASVFSATVCYWC